MGNMGFDRRWLRAVGAVCLAGLIVAGCGQADRDAAPGTTTPTVTQPDITLPARVDGALPVGSLAGLITVVDQVGHSTAAVIGADEPATSDSAQRSLVATSGSLHRYALLLVEVDDEGLNELSALLEDLVEGVDALTAEVAAGRSDFATALADLEDDLEAVQRRWAARSDAWEAAWAEAAAEWDAYRERVAADRESAGG